VPGATDTPTPPPDREPVARFQVHGTTVALQLGADQWYAALIRGASGQGKSDLALRCLAQPLTDLLPVHIHGDRARLVADDRTDIAVYTPRAGPIVTAGVPASIAGLLEVRGLGLIAVPYVAAARLVLVVDLAVSGDVPRHPEHDTAAISPIGTILTQTAAPAVAVLPRISLCPFEASTPLKLLLAVARTVLTGSPVGADAAKPHCLPEGQ
jgi:HPr kinase/phosphorylase